MLRWLVGGFMILAPMTAPVQAGAQDAPFGLDATARTEVLVDPGDGSATVTITYRFTNSSSDISYGALFERIPAGADMVSATMGGAAARMVVFGSDERHASLAVTFDAPIEPGATLEGRIVYNLSSSGDIEALTHVSPGLVAVEPFAVAHGAGKGSLEVRIPAGFTAVQAGGWDVVATGSDEAVFTASDPVPYRPIPLVVENPAALERHDVSSGDLDLTLATLDAGDATETIDSLERVAALVVRRTGLSPARPLEIRHGWTGSAAIRRPDPDRGIAVVSPAADAGVYAEVVAREVLAQIDWADESLFGDVAAAVAASVAPGEGSTDRGRWTDPVFDALGAMDPESAHGVFAALADDAITYPGSERAGRAGPVDWRTLLDAFENLGGVDAAAGFLAAGAPATEVELRLAARAEYEQLALLADGWSLPPYLREPMSGWRFEEFAGRRRTVADLIAARDELEAVADDEGLPAGPQLRLAFEAAGTTMDAPWRVVVEQREAIEVVAEAQTLATSDRGLLAGIGLFGYDSQSRLREVLALWEEGEFVRSRHEAESIIETHEGAIRRGTLRTVVPAASIIALVAAVRWLLGRRLRRADRDGADQARADQDGV